MCQTPKTTARDVNVAFVLATMRHLTEREVLFAGYAICGWNNRRIAEKMDFGVYEVSSKFSMLYKKLGIPKMPPAVRRQYLMAIGLLAIKELERAKAAFEQLGVPMPVIASEELLSATFPSTVNLRQVAIELAGANTRLKRVAQCLANGFDPESALGLSTHTIRSYVIQLYETLGLSHEIGSVRREIIAAAYRLLPDKDKLSSKIAAPHPPP
jgi:DNA-binding NarL/FixJ family response regulator